MKDPGGKRRWLPALLALAILLGLLLTFFVSLHTRTEPSIARDENASEEEDAVLPAPDLASAAGEVERTPLALSPNASAIPAEVVAAPLPEPRIHGTVLNPAREPIRGTWWSAVSILDEDGVRTVTESDADGSYSFSPLALGSYWVSAGAEGYRGQAMEIALTPETPVVQADFILQESVMLKIRLVTPAGGDVFQALREAQAPQAASHLVPVATADHPGPHFREVFGSLNNHFGVGNFWNYGPRVAALPRGYMGILVLEGDLPAWVSLVHYHHVLASQRIEPGQEEVVFVVSPDALVAGLATVQVQVLDAASGLPIPGAKVSLEGHGGYERETSPDADGIAIMKERMPGRFELLVRADGYEKYRMPVEAASGALTDLGVVALNAEVTLRGFVFDGEGLPLAAEFTMGQVDSADRSIRWLRAGTFKSAADGSYEMRGLGRHEYVIRSNNQAALNAKDAPGVVWVSGLIPCDLRTGSLSAFDIRMRPASALVLQVADGLADGLKFRVLDAEGRESLSSRFYGPGPRKLLMPAGRYRVLLLDPSDQVLAEQATTLGAGTARLVLDPE